MPFGSHIHAAARPARYRNIEQRKQDSVLVHLTLDLPAILPIVRAESQSATVNASLIAFQPHWHDESGRSGIPLPLNGCQKAVLTSFTISQFKAIMFRISSPSPVTPGMQTFFAFLQSLISPIRPITLRTTPTKRDTNRLTSFPREIPSQN